MRFLQIVHKGMGPVSMAAFQYQTLNQSPLVVKHDHVSFGLCKQTNCFVQMMVLLSGALQNSPTGAKLQALEGWALLLGALADHAPSHLAGMANQVSCCFPHPSPILWTPPPPLAAVFLLASYSSIQCCCVRALSPHAYVLPSASVLVKPTSTTATNRQVVLMQSCKNSSDKLACRCILARQKMAGLTQGMVRDLKCAEGVTACLQCGACMSVS